MCLGSCLSYSNSCSHFSLQTSLLWFGFPSGPMLWVLFLLLPSADFPVLVLNTTMFFFFWGGGYFVFNFYVSGTVVRLLLLQFIQLSWAVYSGNISIFYKGTGSDRLFWLMATWLGSGRAGNWKNSTVCAPFTLLNSWFVLESYPYLNEH